MELLVTPEAKQIDQMEFLQSIILHAEKMVARPQMHLIELWRRLKCQETQEEEPLQIFISQELHIISMSPGLKIALGSRAKERSK